MKPHLATLGFVRAHPVRTALAVIVGVLVAGWAVLNIGVAEYEANGPHTIASSTVAEDVTFDARANHDIPVEKTICPPGIFRAGEHVICKSELQRGTSQRKSERFNVHIWREEGEMSAAIGSP